MMLHKVTKRAPKAISRMTTSRLFSKSSANESNEVTSALQDLQKATAAKTVPWFLENMPNAYFRSITEADRLQHLNAITALVNAQQPEIMLRSPDSKIYSYIRSGAMYPGQLSRVMDQLPKSDSTGELARVKIFTSLDDTLNLDVFRFGHQEPFRGVTENEIKARDSLLAFCKDIQDGKFAHLPDYPKPAPYFEPAMVDEFIHLCNAMYIQFSHPRRLASQIALFYRVRGTEGVAVEIEHGWESRNEENKLSGGNAPQTMLTIASANVLSQHLLQRSATYLGLQNLNVRRAHLDVINDAEKGSGTVSMVRILVSPSTSEAALDDKKWKQVQNDLKYLKWVDDRVLNMAVQHKNIVDMAHAEVIITYAQMLHGMLAKKDPFAYSLPRIFETLDHPEHLKLANDIANLFLKRFDPNNNGKKMTENELNQHVEKIKIKIRQNVEAEDTINLLNQMVDAVKFTLRTNRFVNNRYALALRMDPQILGYGTVGKDIPYGVFFIYGRRFKGFHVRFRDIARGGLRVVAPTSKDAHGLESARQYNEAYNLAFAQQLKNKDIPEGGSKAVVLVEPPVASTGAALNEETRNFIIRKSIKAFSDALLDLNTTDMEVKDKIVDFYNRDELIYLGPDENIIPEDITWMTKRAAYRKYPIPRAFISSKPDLGINHKVYGVTSEGVAVFADVALRSQNIDPKTEPFTVKITGGTDGDVAGNIIKILHRDYGTNVRVVGICDGTGVIEKPEGLDMGELMRLVEESLPLSSFDTTKLGTNGVFHLTNNQEGIRARNSMHNRVKSDIFIPAGGRPNTINEHNWREYLLPDGKPSCGLIVEGANLFITPEARQLLFDSAGVVIVKDSSANKCGVICSSYEIISSMLLEPNEFLDIKTELVEEVVAKLRQLALVEAELLFREYKQNPNAALPPSSERISRAIIRLHDAIVTHLDAVENENENTEFLNSLIEEHLPNKLKQVALDRVYANVPLAYIKCIIASSLASKIVYREGLQYCESLPEANIANIAVQYLRQENKVKVLIQDVRHADIQNKDEIADLLLRGGVRAGVANLL